MAVFLSSGGAASQLTNTYSVVMNNTVTNTYDVKEQMRWGIVAGGGIARIFKPSKRVEILVGPAAYFVDFDKIQGVESPFSNGGSFDTLHYQFFAHSAALLMESNVIFTASRWQPVFVLGAGNAWNYLYDYSETPVDPNGSASPATDVFYKNRMGAFAYEVGAGVQHTLFVDKKHHMTYRYSLAYRYFNFGAVNFLQSSLQTGTQVLGVKTLHANVILLSLSAIFH